MGAVERLLKFTDLEQEAPAHCAKDAELRRARSRRSAQTAEVPAARQLRGLARAEKDGAPRTSNPGESTSPHDVALAKFWNAVLHPTGQFARRSDAFLLFTSEFIRLI